MAVQDLDLHMFDQYVNASRTLLAELSKIVGDSYDPGENYELTNTIHRAQAISMTVLTMLQSLHAAHAPMVPLAVNPNVPGVPPNPPPNFPNPSAAPPVPPNMQPSNP